MEGLGLRRGADWALRDATFDLAPGEAWGIVGESGAGKSTLLDLALGLRQPTEGRILLDGEPWSPGPERVRRSRRHRMQAVFQDAPGSLPPHRTGWEILQDPLELWGRGTEVRRRQAAGHMAARIKVPETCLDQRPGEWSGGLAQRICLGRALMLEPALLVLDEPFSALDPTLAGHLLALLQDLKAEGLALLLVTHDLRAMRALCDQTLVLHQGRSLWQGPVAPWLGESPHPQLGALWEALPQLRVGG